MKRFERQQVRDEEPDIAALKREYNEQGKFVTYFDEGDAYWAEVGLYRQPEYTAAGKHLSLTAAIELANENLQEWLAYEQAGYMRIGSEQIGNAWVNRYVYAEGDDRLWQRSVIRRGGYGVHVIDDDQGVSGDQLSPADVDRMREKEVEYINALNWQ